MRKITFYLFIILCLLLTACGGGGGGGGSDDPSGDGNGNGGGNGGSGEAVIPASENWLCFKANENNCSISTSVTGSLTTTPTLEYSKDRTTWEPFIVNSVNPLDDSTVPLTNAGDKVYIRATGSNATFSETSSKWIKFVISGSVSASGNIMSLLDKNCGGNSVPQWAFHYLFYNNSTLTTAPDLPATTLVPRCYYQMFYGCSKLKSITVHFTISWNNIFTNNWVYGVPSGGTFTCPDELPHINPTDFGNSRIPTGWTVQHPSTP